jgi:DNA-binding beta-propeller fold protein YncE
MNLFRYLQGLWRRLKPFLLDSRSRSAIWQIWLNRDYTQYAALQNRNDFTLENWNTANRMRMYVRKDILAKVYGAGSATIAPTEDPYAKRAVALSPDHAIGEPGNGAGQLQSPHGVAVAPDGSLYVADSRNHRIQHFSKEGTALSVWGTFADVSKGDAPGGTFNEPWGIAVGNDGTVFVADTWNHRVQKFTADGRFLTMWGNFGLGDSAFGLWGPRGLAIDATGRVYVADTGNKRIVVFDADGNYIAQFGGAGAGLGQFNEPVGVAVDSSGQVYVADTWNQRLQVFAPDSAGSTFSPLLQWPVLGWYGQSVENKPFVATDGQDHVFVTDPEGYRVLEFTSQGEIVRLWGQYSEGPDGFGLPAGITADADGVWVSDAKNHRLLHFALPAL